MPCQVAARLGGRTVDAGKLEEAQWELFQRGANVDLESWHAWCVACGDRQTDLHFKELEWARSRHEQCRAQARSLTVELQKDAISQQIYILTLQTNTVDNMQLLNDVVAKLPTHNRITSIASADIVMLPILNWSSMGLFTEVQKRAQGELLGMLVNTDATNGSIGLAVMPSTGNVHGSDHGQLWRTTSKASEILYGYNVNPDRFFMVQYDRKSDERSNRPLLLRVVTATPLTADVARRALACWKSAPCMTRQVTDVARMVKTSEMVFAAGLASRGTRQGARLRRGPHRTLGATSLHGASHAGHSWKFQGPPPTIVEAPRAMDYRQSRDDAKDHKLVEHSDLVKQLFFLRQTIESLWNDHNTWTWLDVQGPRKFCVRHVLHVASSPGDARRQHRAELCDRFCEAQRRVQTRWPRKVDSKRWLELLGDMIEMALGIAYLHQEHEDVIKTLSPVIYKVNDIVRYIKDHAPCDRNIRFRDPPRQIFTRCTDFSEALMLCSAVQCVDRKDAGSPLRHAEVRAQHCNFQYDA